jgi:hypothetical protein
MPLRIIMTAIPARNNAATFATALAPALPRRLVIRFACVNTTQTITMLASSEAMAHTYPYEVTRIMIVVRAAGPMISGMPIGTTPSVDSGFRLMGEQQIIHRQHEQDNPSTDAEIVFSNPHKCKYQLPCDEKSDGNGEGGECCLCGQFLFLPFVHPFGERDVERQHPKNINGDKQRNES